MFRDLLQEAYAAMRHNRRRTALTMLGMAWGIATVVMLLAYGDGFGQACANIFANFGTKLVIVVPGRTSMQAGGQKSGVEVRFTLDDVDHLVALDSDAKVRRYLDMPTPPNQIQSLAREHVNTCSRKVTHPLVVDALDRGHSYTRRREPFDAMVVVRLG